MSQYLEVIKDETRKLIFRHEDYSRRIAEENVRRARRVNAGSRIETLKVLRPEAWSLARGFNPYKVRSSAERIAHAIRRSIREQRYRPRSPLARAIPKKAGWRHVAQFQIADNAVPRIFYYRLMEKNRPLLSARAYAYRRDLTTHDCLQFIRSEWTRPQRLFIAEYDFTSYFDSINHEHIFRTLRDEPFLVSPAERRIIKAFLEAPEPAAHSAYDESGGSPRDRGIPQGTSISLFLANVAAAALDRALERLGVGFVRYADDTLIWSSDYGRICRAVEVLRTESDRIGAPLNLEKSSGIRLLTHEGDPTEMRATTRVDFLGYQLTLGGLSVKEQRVEEIKAHLRSLIYNNLLRHPGSGTQNMDRLVGRVDKDYVVFISQARRYLYGDLSEVELWKYLKGGLKLRRFKGLMAYYPLVDNLGQLAELDRWLAGEVWLAMRKRARLLGTAGLSGSLPSPHGLSREELIRYRRPSETTGGVLDLRLPSFRRIADAVVGAARIHGPNRVAQGGAAYYAPRKS